MSTIISKYYDAFNAGDMDSFLSLLTEDVTHDINQGGVEKGKEAFRIFMDRMNAHYKERAVDLVIFEQSNGSRAAAEFFIEGEYLKTDEGLPEANGQNYRIRCGAFFSIRKGKIERVTNYYNLQEWMRCVS